MKNNRFFKETNFNLSVQAYEHLLKMLETTKNISLKYDNTEFKLKRLGRGSSKNVYDLGNGNALALFNVFSNPFNPELWERIVSEEVTISQSVRMAGLYAIPCQRVIVTIGEFPTSAILMPTFEYLSTNQGIQIRDNKGSKWGRTLLFGSKDKLNDVDHWKALLEGIIQDISIYYSHSFAFRPDTFHLAIVDSNATPKHDRNEPRLITEFKQIIHIYFFDFTNKQVEHEKETYEFLDKNGHVCADSIKTEVIWMFQDRILDTIFTGLCDEEYHLILNEQKNLGSALALRTKCENVIENEIQPWFVKETTNLIIKNLQKLSENCLQERFSIPVENSNTNEFSC